eukprot:scaffold193_cov255-Pinguiococcus_pyrenoidosus.AAC.23
MSEENKSKEAAKTQETAKSSAGMELLEEDDEFEVREAAFAVMQPEDRVPDRHLIVALQEFETENWDESKEDQEDVEQWQDDWDDDAEADDFCNQLREELAKNRA